MSNPKMKKGAPSLNPNGRPKGSQSAFRKSRILLEAQRDLAKSKSFYRAIINADYDILAGFNITKVTVANQLEAQKQLRAIAKEEVALETAFLQEKANEKVVRAQAKESGINRPVFNVAPSTVTSIRQAG